MKYISEERLEKLWSIIVKSDRMDTLVYKSDLIRFLIESECEELNPWQPIETAPKDREILVYAPAYQDLRFLISVCKWNESAGFCIDELRQPTHWMELPKPPRED